MQLKRTQLDALPTVADIAVEEFTAQEWRDIAVANHEAKTFYYNAMVEYRQRLFQVQEQFQGHLDKKIESLLASIDATNKKLGR